MSFRNLQRHAISLSPLSPSYTANKSISTMLERAAIFCCHHHFILPLIFLYLPLCFFFFLCRRPRLLHLLHQHNIYLLLSEPPGNSSPTWDRQVRPLIEILNCKYVCICVHKHTEHTTLYVHV